MSILQPAEYGGSWTRPRAVPAVIRALTETGLRWGELMGLKAADVGDGQLTVRRVLIEVNGTDRHSGLRQDLKVSADDQIPPS